MNCLHVLAAHPRENAHLIFNCLTEFHSNFPLDTQDAQGNTGTYVFFSLVTEKSNLSCLVS